MKKKYIILASVLVLLGAAYFIFYTMSNDVITAKLEGDALIAAVQRKIDLNNYALFVAIPFSLVSLVTAVLIARDGITAYRRGRSEDSENKEDE